MCSSDLVDGLASRIAANIPPHIQYACRHWIFHITHALISDTLVDLLKEFCTKYLLYWIEVCSLLGELRNALVGLGAVNGFLLVCALGVLLHLKLNLFHRKRTLLNWSPPLLCWMIANGLFASFSHPLTCLVSKCITQHYILPQGGPLSGTRTSTKDCL